MNREFHHIEDLLDNVSFRKWTLGKDNVRSLFWENWAKNHPEKSRMLDQAVEILKAMEDDVVEWEPENQRKIWANIQQKMEPETKVIAEGETVVRTSSSYRNPSRFSGLKVLIILIAVMVGALAWVHLEGIYTETGKTETQSAVAWTVKSTKEGEKKRIGLPDGTVVTLNAASEIRYQSDFGQSNREIWMEGESYFEVAKDSLLPFRVHSGNLVTEALGTAFTVKAYQEEKSVKVKLLEGKVKVKQHEMETDRNQNAIYLTPGQAAFLTEDGFKKDQFKTSKALLWTEGTLFFEDHSFEEVITTLERWYDVDIQVEGRTKGPMSISGEFKKDNLSNVLKSIAYSLGFEYSINHKEVSIHFKEQKSI